MIIVETPLRISFLGGGTDFEDYYSIDGGAVLNCAINKKVFVIVKDESFDGRIHVNYSKKEIVKRVSDIQHELVREALRITGVEKGVEITTLADVPSHGTGLGSSSSITVGLLHALYAYKGESKTAEELAEEACQVEIDILKKPMGRQDQYIAAYGNMRFITFNNNDIGIKVENVPLSDEEKVRLNKKFLLFYTGIVRESSYILSEQMANIWNRIEELRELKKLAFQGKDLLLKGAFDEFGELLHHNWEIKKRLASKITNSEINEAYEAGRRAGAIGGKILGAGGGGFLLLYCPEEKREAIRQALHGLKELPFRFRPLGSRIIFEDGVSDG
jgi:D-glycero-alpha-D-manno-heptose-7-phosphate kinase